MRAGVVLLGMLCCAAYPDRSAFRYACEVSGFSKKLDQMASICAEQVRDREGELNAEAYLLVLPPASTKPLQSVRVMKVSYGGFPENPTPLFKVGGKMWALGRTFRAMWPRRPKKRPIRGAMNVTPVWERQEVSPGRCRPAIGFVMKHRAAQRYQPHVSIDIDLPCDSLRLTDTTWFPVAKTATGVTMRFDTGTRGNERSYRIPLFVRWDSGKTPIFKVATTDARRGQVTDALRMYGRVEAWSPSQKASSGIVAPTEFSFLAFRLGAELGVPVTVDPGLSAFSVQIWDEPDPPKP